MSYSTPEGRIKKKVDELLARYHIPMWVWKPVVRMGSPALDYICCVCGQFLTIETKASGEWLTPRQRQTARDMYLGGATVFIVSSDEGLMALEKWFERSADQFAARQADRNPDP